MVLREKSRWLAAAQLGLISNSFSTLLSQFAAAQLGRDALVDWMTVATIPARDAMLTEAPSSEAIAIGIAFHQWADFSWALVFFGLFGYLTAHLAPRTLACLAIPWALLTSSLEWFVLVPLVPFWQPIFTLQQPYWIGFLVHLSSAACYPVFPWLRFPLGRARLTPQVRLARKWALSAACLLLFSGMLSFAQSRSVILPLFSDGPAADKLYIRHMTTHHEQGIELAKLGVARAKDQQLRRLAALMVASQTGENEIFAHWWAGWFEDPLLICSSDERRTMRGYLTDEQMNEVRQALDDAFDDTFKRLMTIHHTGAVQMADAEWRSNGDPRLRMMAHAIRHEQQGEISLMNNVRGIAAVREATRNMVANNLEP
jgi:uncharacterized protein (DUF305 family)